MMILDSVLLLAIATTEESRTEFWKDWMNEKHPDVFDYLKTIYEDGIVTVVWQLKNGFKEDN